VSGGGLIRCDETRGRYELAGIVTSYLAKISGQEKINTGSSISLRIAYIKKLMSANAQLIGQHFFDNWHDKTLASRP